MDKDKQIVEGLKAVAPLLEASQKQAEKILEESVEWKRRGAFSDGYYIGISEGRRRQRNDFRETLDPEFQADLNLSADEAWEIYKKKKGQEKA